MFTRQGVLIHLPRCLAVGVSMVVLSASSMAADACSQWGVQGTLTLVQTNNSTGAQLKLEQTGSQFKGTASYAYGRETSLLGIPHVEFRSAEGPIVGTVAGNMFEATIFWNNNSVGVYSGQIGPQGLLVGRTYDKTDPAATADFHSDKALVCLTRAESAPGLGTAAAKPTLALGRVQTRAAAPSSTSICDAAQSARARNSPAAPGLERQCSALTEKLNFSPRVLEPAPGSVHRPQTVMAIRVAPGKSAKDTAYELESQVKANFDWRVLTNIPVSAAVAQSSAGYKGWGAHADGTGAQMTAVVGVYRVRAKATAPAPSAPGEWVEFKIDGQPGISIQDAARSPVEKVGGFPAARKAAGVADVTEAPRLNSRSAAASAGMATTPRPMSPLSTAVRSPADTSKNKTDAVLL